MTWHITANPINTPGNFTEGENHFYSPPFKSEVAADGTFSASGMSPAQYYLEATGPNCVKHWQLIEFAEGESKQLDRIPVEVTRKMNVEFVVSPNGNFRNAQVAKTTLGANDRWRTNNDLPPYAFDLTIGQKEGKLLLSYGYAPCYITDLGTAQLSDKLGIGPAAGSSQQSRDVPVENGHVYLVHQAFWKHWILLRATLVGDDDRR